MEFEDFYDSEDDLKGFALFFAIVWALIGLVVLLTARAWYYAIPGIFIIVCAGCLIKRAEWPLPVLTVYSVLLVLFGFGWGIGLFRWFFEFLGFDFGEKLGFFERAAIVLWLPLLTWLASLRQVYDIGLFRNFPLFRRRTANTMHLNWSGAYGQARASSKYQGGLGEPYCSQTCYTDGGRYASSVMLQNQAGVCGFCQKPVRASMYGVPECAAIPFEGMTLFVCPACMNKARSFMNSYGKCCMCQKGI